MNVHCIAAHTDSVLCITIDTVSKSPFNSSVISVSFTHSITRGCACSLLHSQPWPLLASVDVPWHVQAKAGPVPSPIALTLSPP